MRGLFLLLALIVFALPYGATAVAAVPHQQATNSHTVTCIGNAHVQPAILHQVEFENPAAMQMDALLMPAASCPDTGSCSSVHVAAVPLAAPRESGVNALHWPAGKYGLPAETHFPLLRPPIT